MKTLTFTPSPFVSLGVELEYQIVHPVTYDLVSRSKDLLQSLQRCVHADKIKPEITQSMIEINSGIQLNPAGLENELLAIHDYLSQAGQLHDIKICGGGTHPFDRWSAQKIFPSERYKKLTKLFRYLTKTATVFGQHIHIGCPSGEDAIYLTHALTRYVPHFIALSASSPFYQGIDTGFNSSRMTIFSAYPTSGIMPMLKNWQEFSDYFLKMKRLKLIESMKDFYWDIRPKPEFGTVELRVCDTPLTIRRAIMIAAYAQTIAAYLLTERPIALHRDLYHLYSHNRFQAARYGFQGQLIHPDTLQHDTIENDILHTLNMVKKYGKQLNNSAYLKQVHTNTQANRNDANRLRDLKQHITTLPELVKEQCRIWEANQNK